MKAIYFPALWHAAGAIALTFTIAACVPSVEPPLASPPPMTSSSPAPAATPVAATAPTRIPAPTPAPVVQEPQYRNYLDAPQTVGAWNYGADPDVTMAYFGNGGNELAADFVVLCRIDRGEIMLARRGSTAPRALEITTETIVRTVPATSMPREGNVVVATLDANNPLLDAMAITKGRFAVAAEGMPTLYLPAWVEVSRVIEDCR